MDHADFPNPVPPRNNPRINHRKRKITLYFNNIWRRECQSIPRDIPSNILDFISPLYKKDHAQLLEAEHWFHDAYPGRGSIRVSALIERTALLDFEIDD
jgi:hypothetical protein